MATIYADDLTNVFDGDLQSLGNGGTHAMNLRCDMHIFTSSGTDITTSDVLHLGKRKAGETVIGYLLASSANLSAASLAIGITGTTGKYRAAAALPNATQTFVPAISSALDNGPLAADETLIGTISGADVPAGVLAVGIIYGSR